MLVPLKFKVQKIQNFKSFQIFMINNHIKPHQEKTKHRKKKERERERKRGKKRKYMRQK